ncbi:MAG: GspH/FimT family pseudopilin [Pseudoxanthomonas sp.]
MSRASTAGFTLLELMIAIAIAALLLTLALPSFQQTLRSNRVATATNEVMGALALARTEAIRTTRSGGVCPSTAGTGCDGTSWSDGWMVWSDTGSTGWGTFATGDTIVRYSSPRAQVSIDAGTDLKFTFDARGRRTSPAGTDPATVTIAPDTCPSGQQLQRTLTIGTTGQVRMERGNCP